jgi:uncharacterized protein
MFPCTQCGCCCKRVGLLPKGNEFDFPYRAKENGECEMLFENKCKVYDNRPTICNVDELIKILKVDKSQYYKESIIACNQMMDEDGISQEYRIK